MYLLSENHEWLQMFISYTELQCVSKKPDPYNLYEINSPIHIY